MNVARLRTIVVVIGSALVLSSMLSGCSKQPHTQPSTVIPRGDDTEVALACGRASLLMYIMTLDDRPPEFRYLDPRSMPGFDPEKKEHDANAAEYLGEAIEKLGVWTERIANDPTLLNQALQENGWTIVEPGKKIAATARSWPNLEGRVHWCVEHYHVKVADQ